MCPILRPVLIVEGDGDRIAIPELCRRAGAALETENVFPCDRPIKAGDVVKLRRSGEVEKWVTYGCLRPDGNSIILTLDCDDLCLLEIATEFGKRLQPISERFRKPIGVTLFLREFESLFLCSISSIVAHYPEFEWNVEMSEPEEVEEIRGCKETLRRMMGKRGYKETRDQVRLSRRLTGRCYGKSRLRFSTSSECSGGYPSVKLI